MFQVRQRTMQAVNHVCPPYLSCNSIDTLQVNYGDLSTSSISSNGHAFFVDKQKLPLSVSTPFLPETPAPYQALYSQAHPTHTKDTPPQHKFANQSQSKH